MDTHDHDPLLTSLRAEVDQLNAPRGVEKELMQAFARQFPRKRRWYAKWLDLPNHVWALAAGLSTVAAAALLFAFSAHRPHPGAAARPLLARDEKGVFIALDSLERIEREPNPRLVETEVPRTSLASLGVSLTPENAGQPVRAEMLVAADGRPLALRLSSVQ
jgi:hypothetical protein